MTDHFLEMMPDTITFYSSASKDKYGKDTFSGTPITARGRIQYETAVIKDDYGQDVVVLGKVYMYGDYSAITTAYKMTLPNGRSPVILKVDDKADVTTNVHHTVIFFGK